MLVCCADLDIKHKLCAGRVEDDYCEGKTSIQANQTPKKEIVLPMKQYVNIPFMSHESSNQTISTTASIVCAVTAVCQHHLTLCWCKGI
jgi:hypothetical protein